MTASPFSRRKALGALALGGLGAGAAACAAPAPQVFPAWDLADKVVANRAKVKMIGNIAGGRVFSFMRMNIYGDANTGPYTPLFTMNNLIIDDWTVEGDTFVMKKYEAGVKTRFDSFEVIKTLENPFTKEQIDLFPFLLGPITREYTPDGVKAMALAPQALPLEQIGDRLFYASQSIGVAPSMIRPEEYPAESPGNEIFLNSFMTYSALAQDVFNPEITSAAVHMQIQNKFNWPPWMKMGQRPGGTVARGFGSKIASLEALPKPILDGFREVTPKILDVDKWEGLNMETIDYLRFLRGEAPM
jgi:hypothetical protein